MNHIIKFSTNHAFYAFSKKYYELSFHTCCLNHQRFLSNQRLRYKVQEKEIVEKIKTKKSVKGYKKRLKKTELLKVTNTSATQERMTVSKLKASQIAAFAKEPGMVIENLYGLKYKKEERLCEQNVADENEDDNEYALMLADKFSVMKFMRNRMKDDLRNIPNPFHTIWKTDCQYNDKFWVSYIDVCLNGNLSYIALQVLDSSRHNYLSYEAILTNIVRNKGPLGNFWIIKNFLDLEYVRLTPKIVVFYLDCLYRSDVPDNVKLEMAKSLIDRFLSSKDQTLDQLSREASMYYMKNVLELMQTIYHNVGDFGPEIGPSSTCQLVTRIYETGNYKVSPSHPEISKQDFMNLAKEQINTEVASYVEIDSILNHSKNVNKCAKKLENLLNIWRVKLGEDYEKCIESLKYQFDANNLKTYPFLNSIAVNEMVEVMIGIIQSLCTSSDLLTFSIGSLYRSVGQRVWERYNIKNNYSEEKLKSYENYLSKYFEWYCNSDGSKLNYRQKWQSIMWECDDKTILNEFNIKWNTKVEEGIGRIIFDLIFKSATIPSSFLPKIYGKNDVPAFYVMHRDGSRSFMEQQVKCHPFLHNLYENAKSNKLLFSVQYLPMISPPKPWTSIYNGGLYVLPSRFLRHTQRDYSLEVLSQFSNKSLYSIFDSLNQLQSVAWVINTKILDIAIDIFKNGGSEELDVPLHPDSFVLPKFSASTAREYFRASQRKRELYGLWCECLYKLSLANHFRDRTFWLPYNLDFRGRAYPLPPHVNHICADLYRSFFLFAKKKCLGAKGFEWLKIHCINLCGTHKRKSLSERLTYAEEVMPEIIDSAEKPLDGRRWWMKSDDPWQTLATCMEIRNALESGNPETYETGLPVHQDGSCNGLQHYAALGKDPVGASSVNLSPSEYPQDVYETVVNIVEKLRKKDVEKDVEIAKKLEGFVIRKICKQTVMTTVYGVTAYGAKMQIANKLKDFNEFPPELVSPASAYLARKIFEALNEMFTSAQKLQHWFSNCAHLITSKLSKHVTWITPLGLPVVQPYFKRKERKNMFFDDEFTPSVRKQKNAFPPNFIHSLDSSHMMLTALECGMKGITFASIHDCFWTHAADIDRMNVICRSKFIELHSEKNIENLSRHFIETYCNENVPNELVKEASDMFRSAPKHGKFDLNDVAKSVYFFS